MKRVLIFSTAYYPFVGGAEVAVKEITDRIGEDYEFDLITVKLESTLPSFEKVGRVNVYRLGSGKSFYDKLTIPFKGALFVYRLSKTQDYFCFWAVMATFSSGAGYICNIMSRISGKKKIPMILTLQEGDSESYLKYKWAGLLALSWTLALWQTDHLTAISTFLLKRAESKGYKGEWSLVPNGVDVDFFSQEIKEETKEELKERLGKKSGDIFLVTSGRLTYKNATDDIISSLKHLPENISLIVIGKGVVGKEDEGPHLQKMAKELGLSHRVKFLGFIPHADMPKYLSICDIFIRPSRSEGFGNSFIEAMVVRLPVIATPVGGIPDFIDDKETGLFCSPDNPQSIAVAVKTILNDPVLKERIVEKAYARVSERYSWDHVAEEMKAVFDRFA